MPETGWAVVILPVLISVTIVHDDTLIGRGLLSVWGVVSPVQADRVNENRTVIKS